jgi:hypothetical protein
MTTWTRDRIVRHCGLCGQAIPVGDVFQRIAFGWSAKARKYRCATCAGGPVPDLPPDPPPAIMCEAAPPPKTFHRVGLPLDYKQRQSREPGEEG